MITCYLLDGKTSSKGAAFKDFKTIEAVLKQNQSLLWEIPAEAVVMLLDAWGKAIAKDKDILKTEGAAYLSFYLKRNNVENLINRSVGNLKFLDEFAASGRQPGKYLKAQGRGIVCHWIAGNVKTLAIYSLINSLLSRNSNILRVPEENAAEVLEILYLLEDISIEYNGRSYNASGLTKNIALVYFDSRDELLNSGMSRIADARVIWGG
ncbi:MAG TPA: acyl-CoA reductase, partial [Clostridiaceae bacterium]